MGRQWEYHLSKWLPTNVNKRDSKCDNNQNLIHQIVWMMIFKLITQRIYHSLIRLSFLRAPRSCTFSLLNTRGVIGWSPFSAVALIKSSSEKLFETGLTVAIRGDLVFPPRSLWFQPPENERPRSIPHTRPWLELNYALVKVMLLLQRPCCWIFLWCYLYCWWNNSYKAYWM